ELALLRIEVAVGHVDGDALLALGGQAVQEQRVIDALALGAVAAAVGLQRGQLVVEQALALVQQAPDQGALAVVDAAAGDEAQQRLGLVLAQVGADGADAGIAGGRSRGGGALRHVAPGRFVLPAGGINHQFRIAASHQKYPSSFFFSIDAVGSWSITRPWRSERVATSISAMMSSRVAASDSIAPVSG